MNRSTTRNGGSIQRKKLITSHLILGGPLGFQTEDAGLRCQRLIFDAVGYDPSRLTVVVTGNAKKIVALAKKPILAAKSEDDIRPFPPAKPANVLVSEEAMLGPDAGSIETSSDPKTHRKDDGVKRPP